MNQSVSFPLNFPALHASHGGIWMATPDGETRSIGKGEAISRAAETPFIIMNAPLVAQRLGYPELSGLDLLELFAFMHPAQFMVPTPKGLASKLGLNMAAREDEQPKLYLAAAQKLLSTLIEDNWHEREGAWNATQALSRLRWPWASEILKYLHKPERGEKWLFSKLPEWEEQQQRGSPRNIEIQPQDIQDRLATLTGKNAEQREGQKLFAANASHVFSARSRSDEPNMLLAEAGTGIGKTLGYLAPATIWSERADGAVWISTFTKALQRQLVSETRRQFTNEENFRSKVAIRKGRENYLCLLNLEDALQGGFAGRAAILAHLVARWAAYTSDGDMVGGDLPGWLATLFRRNGSTALTDRRGECVYAGCAHYKKCFIEHSTRSSQNADIVIANHALMMVNAARGRDEGNKPSRIIFDEGHHLFDAADSMFASALTGQETIELRRWIIGPEGKSRGRRRGLGARLADISSYDEAGGLAIEAIIKAAEALPSEGWLQRIGENAPFGPVEKLLSAIRSMVFARDESGSQDSGYSLETELAEVDVSLIDMATECAFAFDAIIKPLTILGQRLEALLTEPPDWMDGQSRARIDGAMSSLGWRVDLVKSWMAMLARIHGTIDPDFVDWLCVDRYEGREYDIGMHRRWLDPMKPVAELVLKPAHGVLATSATLRAGGEWENAHSRSGAVHLSQNAKEFSCISPFDYSKQAEVLIVTDVKRGDLSALASAYGQLITASGGGALGLFTAIRRLRSVHARIADRMARDGLPLYAQHVDPIDTGTLVDIFRDDPHASLLGTDALRDGVDVPGESLRLVIMEQTPWPRPDILHKARRLADGGSAYDDRIIRARLAQAFGRLIRSKKDKGRFILLSAAMPSRLLTAFPEGTPIRRVTLEEAVNSVRTGLSSTPEIGQEEKLILPEEGPII